MRGIYTPVTALRRQVFAEIAKLAYNGDDFSKLNEIPFEIITGEVPIYRDSVFKERAIVSERLRLAMGLPVRRADEHSAVSKGVDDESKTKTFEAPLVNVIPFACDECDTEKYLVTDNCRGCLAHPCTSVCPVKAVSMVDGKSHIDTSKCVKCGRCKEVCPYSAIIKTQRPCAAACGVNAITSDHLGRAKIDYDKCVSCGMCLVSCPFGAISDKSELYQVVSAIKAGENVCAAIAPAFVGQFGPLATPERIVAALKEIGFNDVVEVALGADLGAVEEAHHFAHSVPSKQPFLATSCCPSWSAMAKLNFPELKEYISESYTPMNATGKAIKDRNENAKVVFIGPCIAKKLEAKRRSVKSYVDYVITFEELMGMFVAKGIEFSDISDADSLHDATTDGRGYGVAGGVAEAIAKNVKELYPDVEIQTDRAEGLANCKKMLMLAKAGKRNGYLLEGMACPGGCVGGPGTLMPPLKAAAAVKAFSQKSEIKLAAENPKIKEDK